MLKTTGRAAVVVPDNVLFEGGAEEVIRRKLLQNTDLQTILRLPTGIFYGQGVKANVIFFDNRQASPNPQTSKVWFYDYRSNVHHTLEQKPLTHGHLEDFVLRYNPVSRLQRKAAWSNEAPDGRWRVFSREELLQRDKASLDLFWLKDATMTDLENLPDPDVLISEIMENMEAAMEQFVAASRT
jgi:type I restriction enzyme M protein